MKSALVRLENPAALWMTLSAAALVALTLSVAMQAHPGLIVPAAFAVGIAPVAVQMLRRWELMIALLISVIMFIPIERYKIPVGLPFDLEPYRLVTGLLILLWTGAVLVDPCVRLARTPFDRRVALVLGAALASVTVNPGSLGALSDYVTKALMLLFSFVLVYFLVASVVRSAAAADFLVKTLVLCGSLVGVASIVERRTQYNVFDHVTAALPFLQSFPASELFRGGQFRAVASAQHPIALSAALAMLIPLAYYLIQSGAGRAWWVAAGGLLLGSLSTGSRTGVLMLIVIGIVMLFLRGAEVRRLVPLLIPLVVAVHIALPGALGTIKGGFFPQGGLIAEQTGNAQARGAQSTRLSRIGPASEQLRDYPVFGQGYGTRVRGADVEFNNAVVLDNQWLGTLLETGVVGGLAWAALIWGAVRRLGSAAKRDLSSRGTLLGALAASLMAFGIGMLTFDAFSFIQVTFLFWILLALGAARLKMME